MAIPQNQVTAALSTDGVTVKKNSDVGVNIVKALKEGEELKLVGHTKILCNVPKGVTIFVAEGSLVVEGDLLGENTITMSGVASEIKCGNVGDNCHIKNMFGDITVKDIGAGSSIESVFGNITAKNVSAAVKAIVTKFENISVQVAPTDISKLKATSGKIIVNGKEISKPSNDTANSSGVFHQFAGALNNGKGKTVLAFADGTTCKKSLETYAEGSGPSVKNVIAFTQGVASGESVKTCAVYRF